MAGENIKSRIKKEFPFLIARNSHILEVAGQLSMYIGVVQCVSCTSNSSGIAKQGWPRTVAGQMKRRSLQPASSGAVSVSGWRSYADGGFA